MGFKLAMAEVSQEDLKTIREDRPTGGYDGPTPPPGVYQAKIAKIWFAETKNGKPAMKVSYVIHEDKDSANAVYNGASTIDNLMIPTDPSDNNFAVQTSVLDSFLLALSDGKMGYPEFYKAMTEGRSDVGKEDKIGNPVNQIGNVKITGDKIVKVKTKVREYNGKDYIDIHYILRDEAPKKGSDDIDIEVDTDSDVNADTDLDDWLEA